MVHVNISTYQQERHFCEQVFKNSFSTGTCFKRSGPTKLLIIEGFVELDRVFINCVFTCSCVNTLVSIFYLQIMLIYI